MHVIMDGYRSFQVQNVLKSSAKQICIETKNEAKQQAKSVAGDQDTKKVVGRTIKDTAPAVSLAISAFSEIGYKRTLAAMNNYNLQYGKALDAALDRAGLYVVGSTNFGGSTIKTEAGEIKSVLEMRKLGAERCRSLSVQLEYCNIKLEQAGTPEAAEEIKAQISEITKRLADEKETLINLSKSEWIDPTQTATSMDMEVELKRYVDFAQAKMEKIMGDKYKGQLTRPTVFVDKKGLKLDDGIIHTHHIDHQAHEISQTMALYEKSFEKHIQSIYNTPELRRTVAYHNLMDQHKKDKKLVKGMGKLAKKADKLEQRRIKKLKATPRKLISVVTTPLNQTEAGKGYQFLHACANATKGVSKVGYKATEVATQKTIYAVKVYKKMGELRASGVETSKKALKEGAKTYLSNQGITGKVQRDFFKSKIRNRLVRRFDAGLERSALEIKKAAKSTGKLSEESIKQLANIERKMAMSQAFKEGGIKGTGKEVLKSLNQTYKPFRNHTKVGKALSKVKAKLKWKPNMIKIGQRAYKEASKAVTKLAAKTMQALIKIFGAGFKAIASMVAPILAALLPILPFVLIACLLIIILLNATGQTTSIPSQGYPGSYELAGNKVGKAFNFKTKLKILQDCHDKFLEELEEEKDDYDVVQIIYDNGSEENYQEILCAYYTEVHDDEASFSDSNDPVAEVILPYLYEKTHSYYTEDYEVDSDDGSESEDVSYGQLHIGIQRDDYLVYELLQDVMGGRQDLSGDEAEGVMICPTGTADPTDWLNIVSTIKELIATACRSSNVGYSQEHGVSIELNGTTYSNRRDCSGYVSMCLSAYTGQNFDLTSEKITKAKQGYFPGFTKYVFSGWDNLQPGDIISYCGHVEVFAGLNENRQPLVYSNGSTRRLRSSLALQEDRAHTYSVVWRPNNAGTGTGDGTGTDGEETDNNHNLIKSLVNVASGQVSPYTKNAKDIDITDDAVTGIMIDSNTKDREYDKDGNEIGYEKPLVRTAKDLVDDDYFSSGFWSFDYDGGNGWHSLVEEDADDNDTGVSSLDYLRVVYAKHGLMIPSSIYTLINYYPQISYSDLKIGDIVIYTNPGATSPEEIKKNIAELDSSSLLYATQYENWLKYYDYLTPLMYIGDDEFIGYSLDITLDAGKYLTQTSNKAKVRIYKLEDLDPTLMECHEVNGILKDPVYGHNYIFEGWTDQNIETYLNYNDSFGTTALTVNPDKDYQIEEVAYFKEYTDMVENNEDMFSTMQEDMYFMSDSYHDRILEEMKESVDGLYEDYGVFGGVMIALAMTKSYNFSTEQAVTMNNYFNIMNVSGADTTNTNGKNAIIRYSYDKRQTNTSRQSYNVYATVEECMAKYAESLSTRLAICHNNDTNFKYDSADAFISDLETCGIITSAEKDQLNTYYKDYNLKKQDPELPGYYYYFTGEDMYDDVNGVDWSVLYHTGDANGNVYCKGLNAHPEWEVYSYARDDDGNPAAIKASEISGFDACPYCANGN